MRFIQLKHDPNNIMRKKLVKSKKDWIVVATLSLAGGIFLMGSPTLNVKADTTPTQITANANTTSDDKASTNVPSETKNTNNTAATTTSNSSTDNENQTATTDSTETNLAKSKAQLESLGVTPTELSADTNTDTTTNNGNIAQGVQGTTPWFISADGSLHLGDNTQTTALADNTTTTTDKVSGNSSTDDTDTATSTPTSTTNQNATNSTGTSNTTTQNSNSTDTTPTNISSATDTTTDNTAVATSPWQKYSNDINDITFDGKVTAANDMNHMFSDLSNLTTINNINQLDTTNTTNVSGLFANDTKLTTVTGSKSTDNVVDLSDLNLTSVKDTSDMFLDDSSIQNITFPARGSTLSKNANFNYMFKNDASLNTLTIPNWQFSYAKTMLGMFQNDKNLKSLSISSWNMATNPDTGDSSQNEGMFDGTDLQSIILSSADTFKDYTALPSTKSNGWTNGSVAFSAEPNNSDNYTYNLNSVKGQLSLKPTTFTPNSESDPTVPTYSVTLTVPTSLGDQTFQHTGALNSSFSVTPKAYPGYTPDISTVVATVTSTTQATTNYYINYVGNLVDQWTVNNVTSPTGQTMTVTGTTSSTGDPARIGDTFYIAPDTTGTGYTFSKMGSGLISADANGNPTFEILTQPQYLGIDIPASSAQFTTTTGITKDVIIPEGQYGNISTTITVPNIPGYTLSSDSPTTLNVVYNKDGTSSVDTSKVQYIPNTVTSWTVDDVDGPDNTKVSAAGTTNSDNTTAKIGDIVSINPVVTGTGYQVDQPGVGIIQADPTTGNPIVKVTTQPTYKPITIPQSSITFTAANNAAAKVVIPEGTYGNTTTTIEVPSIPGYTLSSDSPTTLNVTYNKDGTSFVDTSKVQYIPNTVTSWTVDNVDGPDNTKISASGTTNSNNTTAKIGDTVSIKPDVTGTGYQVNQPGVGIIQANPTTGDPEIQIKTEPTYEPVTIPNSIQNITTKDGTTIQVTIPSGNVTIKNQTVPVPQIPGYTVSESTLPISYNKDGSVTVDSSNLIYAPNNVPNWSTTITDPNGKDFQISGTNAKVGQTITLLPKFPGYDTTAGSATIEAKSDGSTYLKVTKYPIYTATKVPSWSTTVNGPANDSQITITGSDASYGQTVILNPDTTNSGYTVSQPGIGIIAVDKNGNFYVSVTQQPQYAADPVQHWSTTVTLPNHQTMQISGNTNSDNQSAKFGDTVIIDPGKVSGYQVTPGQGIIVADKNGQPTIEITIAPKFTRIPSPITQPTIQKIQATISTYPDLGNVPIYQLSFGNMTVDNNRQLAPKTDWYTDQTITIAGIKYYRVAIDEWVQASRVYPYQESHQYIRTYDNTDKLLYKSENQLVKNRALQPDSDWYSDRTTDINGKEYYRIATDEFVSADDAYVYQPINIIVRIPKDSSTQNLYTANGKLITNRALVHDSDWIVDSIVYINGVEYYRIAIDEFVKASSVEIER